MSLFLSFTLYSLIHHRFRESAGALTWDQAQSDCQSDYGSDLAYLHDNDEADWLAEQVETMYGASTYVWLGLKRDTTTDTGRL